MAKPKLALIPASQGSKVFSVLPSSGVGDFDFSRSGSATRINSQGLIEEVSNGQSRLNYPMIDGVVNGCPSLLLEPQRTNLITYSEDFNGSGWLTSSLTATDNQVVSPDGTLNASKLEMTGDGSLRNSSEISFNDGYAYSIFIKKGNSRYVTIRSAFFTTSVNVGFDLDTLTAQTDGKIEDYGNDWYRLSISKNISGDADKIGYFYLYLPDSLGSITSVSGNYVYAYGAQVEEGSYATSYIPTNGATVTRLADECNGAGNADTFNDSEGVLMAEIGSDDAAADNRIYLSDGSDTNRVFIILDKSQSSIKGYVKGAAGYALSITSVGYDVSLIHKVLIKYKSNDYSFWINGFKVGSETTSTILPSGLNQLSFNGTSNYNPFYGNTKQLQYYNTALTDSELEQLTSWTSFSDMANGQLYTIE